MQRGNALAMLSGYTQAAHVAAVAQGKCKEMSERPSEEEMAGAGERVAADGEEE